MAGLKKELHISHSDSNGNYFVKMNGKLIAGFVKKSDAEIFVKAKENDKKIDRII